MDNKNRFMEMACGIAFTRMGCTSPNPAVGAVIVKNGTVAGTGGTGPYGCDHAEVAAIRDALSRGADISDAEIYVSLEPCSHYGKTPPCTEAIINAGIKKVYSPILDPNPAVSGRGFTRLSEAGIEVKIMHGFAGHASDLLRGFKKLILRGDPFIINKCAMTLDGRIATSAGDSKWISNDYSRLVAHRLRRISDAVIIGKNTFMNDNPSLTVRFNDFGSDVSSYMNSGDVSFSGRKNFFIEQIVRTELESVKDPLRVLVGVPETVPDECNLFRDDNHVLIAGKDEFNRKTSGNPRLKEKLGGINVVLGDFSGRGEEVRFIMEYLAGRGVLTALLEGGGGLNGTFNDAGEIDQYIYIVAPKILGSGLSPVKGAEREMISESVPLQDITSVMLGSDTMICGYREKYNFEMM